MDPVQSYSSAGGDGHGAAAPPGFERDSVAANAAAAAAVAMQRSSVGRISFAQRAEAAAAAAARPKAAPRAKPGAYEQEAASEEMQVRS